MTCKHPRLESMYIDLGTPESPDPDILWYCPDCKKEWVHNPIDELTATNYEGDEFCIDEYLGPPALDAPF